MAKRKTKTVNNWNLTPAKIKAREAAFKALPVAKKRVAVAKDVIAALKAQAIKASSGTYFEVSTNRYENKHYPGFEGWENPLETTQLRDVLADPVTPPCSVCAIGAIFTCQVMLVNKFKGADPDRNEMVDHLSGLFDDKQLSLIEVAFEVHDRYFEGLLDSDETNAALAFGRKSRRAADRMIAIMENIIKNKGEFRP